MKLNDLLRYVIERGAEINVKDGRLFIRGDKNLTPLCQQVLNNRRAEIYQHFRLPLPDSNVPLESCPHCRKPLIGTDANATQGGEF